jgi:hypothetical protein
VCFPLVKKYRQSKALALIINIMIPLDSTWLVEDQCKFDIDRS